VCTSKAYRGFESLSLRSESKEKRDKKFIPSEVEANLSLRIRRQRRNL